MMKLGDDVPVEGCRLRLRHLHTSTGVGSMDTLLGGGILNASVVCFHEPMSHSYAQLIHRCFLSEGFYLKQPVFVAGPHSVGLLSDLPEKAAESPELNEQSKKALNTPEGPLKIAWKYENVGSILGFNGPRYDLDKAVPRSEVESKMTVYNTKPSSRNVEFDTKWSYEQTLNDLKRVLNQPEHTKKVKGGRKRLLRIVLTDVGGPYWRDTDLLGGFMTRLQGVLRDAYAVVMLNVSSAVADPSSLEADCDAAFRLVSINERERQRLPPHLRFNGYFRIAKMPRQISLAPAHPPAFDVVFEVRKSGFWLKVHHLPPASGAADGDKPACGADF